MSKENPANRSRTGDLEMAIDHNYSLPLYQLSYHGLESTEMFILMSTSYYIQPSGIVKKYLII